MDANKNITLLIADDEAAIRNGLSTVVPWEQFGITIVGTAEDGREAYDIIKSCNPDIVITDIRMPGMDGLETLRHMKEKAPNLPVILLTGHACMGVAVQGLDLGAYDYMLKPVAISELIIKMEEAARSAM